MLGRIAEPLLIEIFSMHTIKMCMASNLNALTRDRISPKVSVMKDEVVFST